MIGTALLVLWILAGGVITHMTLTSVFKGRGVRQSTGRPFLPLGRLRVDILFLFRAWVRICFEILGAVLETVSRVSQLVLYFVLWPLALWWMHKAFTKTFPLKSTEDDEVS